MTVPTGVISGVSVSHERASVEEIERACTVPDATAGSDATAVSDSVAVEALCSRDDVREAFVVQTCNRAEAYVVTEDAATGREVLAGVVEAVPPGAVRELGHEESLRHLMRVAAGLESLILGEDQVLGQVRDAYEAARAADGVGPVLEEGLLKAIRVGERARSETVVNEGVVSLGSAAAELAATERDLEGATAAVVGAGEMGTLAAKALDGTVASLTVANRTLQHAEHVGEALEGDAQAVGLDDLGDVIAAADVVISATDSDDPVLTRSALADAGRTLIVDIAQPRDVAPGAAALPSVTVRDLDALEALTDETLDRRRRAAERVEAMIDDAFDELMTQYKRKRADEVIAAMYEGAERTKNRELGEALSRLEAAGGLNDDQREAVEAMAEALVKQLLAAPTESLRDAAENDDWSTINTALQLFDPTDAGVFSDATPAAIPDDTRDGMPDAVLEHLVVEED